MLKFKITTVIFGLLMANAITLSFFMPVPWWYFLLLVICYLLMLFYGSYYVGASFFMPIICKAKTTEKKIALSFDDGPNTNTKEILSILESQKVTATFFCIGKHISMDKDLFQLIYNSGHLIGNHSYSHTISFDFWSAKKVQQDLERTQALIYSLTGQKTNWFRPPFGVSTPSIARTMNYKTIGWSIRSFDTMTTDADKLFRSVKRQLHPGAIILFHDSQKVTVDMLPRLLQFIKEQGYEIVPLDKLLHLQAYVN